MLVRAAEESDYQQFPALIRELGYTPGDRLESIFKEIIKSPFMGILVAENNFDQIDGFLSYSFKPQLRLNGIGLEVDELVVFLKARGSGIGKMLLDAVRQKAIETNCSRIILSSNRERESYQRDFYKKNGFVEVDSAFLMIQLR